VGVPLILVLGTALGLAYNAADSRPIPWIAQPRTAVSLDSLEAADAESSAPETAADFLGIPESEFPIAVSLEKAKELYDSGRVIILDAREEHEYAEGHIKDAVVADYDVVGADLEWLDAMAAEPTVILVYCGGGDCELSMNLGFAISQSGHRHVVVFEDGYTAWKSAGYPTRMGDRP